MTRRKAAPPVTPCSNCKAPWLGPAQTARGSPWVRRAKVIQGKVAGLGDGRYLNLDDFSQRVWAVIEKRANSPNEDARSDIGALLPVNQLFPERWGGSLHRYRDLIPLRNPSVRGPTGKGTPSHQAAALRSTQALIRNTTRSASKRHIGREGFLNRILPTRYVVRRGSSHGKSRGQEAARFIYKVKAFGGLSKNLLDAVGENGGGGRFVSGKCSRA